MKVLALEKDIPGVSDEKFTEQVLMDEAARAWELYKAGVFRELYFRADKEYAVLILECETVEEARKIILTLPLVRNHLIDFEFIPLKAYPGFERLFRNQKRY